VLQVDMTLKLQVKIKRPQFIRLKLATDGNEGYSKANSNG